jgi:peptide/nickel transport system ATP-binding protein
VTEDAVLSVEGLSIAFDSAEIVSDVSFTLHRGEVLGIVGESGCGKSATALAIMGLLPRTARVSGRIRLGDDDLATMSPRALRRIRGRRIGMVFQEPMSALDPVFPVGEQIAETLRAHLRLSHRTAAARAIELLDQVGIADPAQCARRHPSALSGGMRQRVTIAIAIACAPDVLIADEPTTALDVTIQAQIMELLLALGRASNMAILFITHDLGLVAESCDRMLTMYAGQIVEDGTVDAVLRRPLHPYSSGLLRALPQLSPRGAELPAIPGRVPSAQDMPPGCRFAPRCHHAEPCCTQQQHLQAEAQRQVRCMRHAALHLPGAAHLSGAA